MKPLDKSISTIDDYINSYPEEIKVKLIEIRKLIKSVVPDATEKISHHMPTFYLNGFLMHFAGCKNHIGFYPGPTAITNFKNKLNNYTYAKVSVQFPLDKPLPKGLIKDIVKFRKTENLSKKKK